MERKELQQYFKTENMTLISCSVKVNKPYKPELDDHMIVGVGHECQVSIKPEDNAFYAFPLIVTYIANEQDDEDIYVEIEVGYFMHFLIQDMKVLDFPEKEIEKMARDYAMMVIWPFCVVENFEMSKKSDYPPIFLGDLDLEAEHEG